MGFPLSSPSSLTFAYVTLGEACDFPKLQLLIYKIGTITSTLIYTFWTLLRPRWTIALENLAMVKFYGNVKGCYSKTAITLSIRIK